MFCGLWRRQIVEWMYVLIKYCKLKHEATAAAVYYLDAAVACDSSIVKTNCRVDVRLDQILQTQTRGNRCGCLLSGRCRCVRFIYSEDTARLSAMRHDGFAPCTQGLRFSNSARSQT